MITDQNILSKKKGEKFQTFQSQRFLYQIKKQLGPWKEKSVKDRSSKL